MNTLENIGKNFNAESIIKIIIVLVVVIIAYIAVVIIQRKLKKRLQLDNIRRSNNYSTLFRIVKILLIIGGMIAILQTVGINLSVFSIGFGVIVLLLVFAVKDALQDIFSGIMIMTDKYYTVGDAVEFEGRDGIVISFTVRTTKIEFLDDRSVMSVSNRHITKIRKLTHLVDIDLPLPYELERERAYSVLEGICEKIRRIKGIESCELKGTQNFGESAIIYKIRFFCEPNERPDIRREALRTIQDGLSAEDIHIPYTQLDIHTK